MSWPRALAVLPLLMIAAAVACSPSATDGTATPTTRTLHAGDVPLVRKPGDAWFAEHPERLRLARVDRVVDGDTLLVDTDGRLVRIRVFGIAAPELADPCGAEATEALRRVTGTKLILRDERPQDQFGRELRYLFTPAGQSIDAELIRQGAARAWRDDGAYRDTLVAVEASARSGGTGCLWRG